MKTAQYVFSCLLMRALLCLSVTPLIGFVSSAAIANAQEIDGQRQFRGASRAALKWNNVSNQEQWLRGVEPNRSEPAGLHRVTLQPGFSTEFLVPPHEMVRVVSADGQSLSQSGLEIWTSNGTGLYRKQVSAISTDGQSVISAPDQSAISTARVRLADTATQPVCVCLFTSSRAEPQRLDYYQCKLNGKQCSVNITDNVGSRKLTYAAVESDQAHTVNTLGQTRLRIETRLKYDTYTNRRDTYWIRVNVEGQPTRVLTFDTTPQKRSRVFVNECEQIVGVREFSYIDLPEPSPNVTIEASHPLYMRVDEIGLNLCRPRPNQIFQLPTNPQFDPAAQLNSEFDFATVHAALPTHGTLLDPYLNQQTILGLARNNRIRRGGLRAYMWMRAIATLHYGDATFRDEITVPEMAARIRGFYTFFRDLMPLKLGDQNTLRIVYFPVRKIRDPKSKFTETIVGENYIDESIKPQTAMLFKTTSRDSAPLRYRPASDLGTSLMRVVVDQSNLTAPCKLMVQYDDAEPIEFQVECGSALPLVHFKPSSDDAGRSALAKIYTRYDSDTTGGPFGQFHTPRANVNAGSAELLLPAGVQEIKAWIVSPQEVEVHIGLQHLDGRKYQLSERAHLHLRNENRGQFSPEYQSFLAAALDNETYPFQELLASHQLNFSSGVEASSQIADPTDLWPNELIQQRFELSEQMANQKQWPAAIEALSDIINHSTGSVRNRAIVARINSLISTGEHTLAKSECHGWVTFRDDPELRNQLIRILLREAKVAHAPKLRENYLAIKALHDQSLESSILLADEFASQGRFRFALMALPTLQATPETEDLILGCTYQLNWWQLFDATLQTLADDEKRNLWNGLKQSKLGLHRSAQTSLIAAGELGQPWLEYWRQGDSIYQGLISPDETIRSTATADWKNWHQTNPGPTQWSPDPTLVKHSSGAAVVFAKIPNTASQFFLATPDKPGVICVHGPRRIRIESRPIHNPETDNPLQDWLTLSLAGQTEKLPILNNYVAELLQINGAQNEKLGMRVDSEIVLPAGPNYIYVSAEKHHLMFRVLIQRPEITLPVLPIVNQSTMEAVRLGEFGSHIPCCAECLPPRDCIRLVSQDGSCRSIPLAFKQSNCRKHRTHYGGLEEPFENEVRNVGGYTIETLDAVLHQSIRAALESESTANLDPQQRIRSLAQLYRLVQDNPSRKDIKRLYDRTKSGFSWERVQQFDSHAGIHNVAFFGWQPENPQVRIRKSLMGPWQWDYVLAGNADLDLQVDGSSATRFRIEMQRPRVGFTVLASTEVLCRSNQGIEQIRLDSPDQVGKIDAAVDAGAQVLNLRQRNPLANHFVGLTIHEVLSPGNTLPTNTEKQRRYQVALPDEPLRFRVAGPAIIRIDRGNDDLQFIKSETVVVEESIREFILRPSEGKDFEYFRIFAMVPGPTPSPTHRKQITAPLAQGALAGEMVDSVFQQVQQVGYFDNTLPIDALSLRSPAEQPAAIQLDDEQKLGLQELGTLYFETGYYNRRPLAEGSEASVAGRFLEAKVGRHYYDSWKDKYSFTNLFVRPRIDNGTTFGLRHGGSLQLENDKCCTNAKASRWTPARLSWNTYGLVQNAGTPLDDRNSSNPWTFGGSVRLTRKQILSERWAHSPSASVFGRVLSEDNNFFEPGVIDQDVFTNYKRNHRFGFKFSDRFVYQNCEDKRYWVRPQLTTNEAELTPDNLGLSVGTDQLVGPLQLQLAYRYTNFIADSNRAESSSQNLLRIGAILERWHHAGRRSELRFDLQHSIEASEGTSFSFSLVSFLNDGRGYRDFAPNQMLFKSLKRQRAAQQFPFD